MRSLVFLDNGLDRPIPDGSPDDHNPDVADVLAYRALVRFTDHRGHDPGRIF
jgi:hypothetical protein